MPATKMPLVHDELRKLAAAKLAHEKPGQMARGLTAAANSQGRQRRKSGRNPAFVPVDKFEVQPTEASFLPRELSMSRFCNASCRAAATLVLALVWTVAGAGLAPAGEPDRTKVIRDEVQGSILHGGGKTK
jgi:hypothetical protein